MAGRMSFRRSMSSATRRGVAWLAEAVVRGVRAAPSLVNVIQTVALTVSIVVGLWVTGTVLWGELERDPVVVEPFDVPAPLVARGFTGRYLANRLIDQLSRIAAQTQLRPPSVGSGWSADAPHLSIPGVNVSLDSIVPYVEQSLGRLPRHVAGEVVTGEQPTDLTLSVRVSGTPAEALHGDLGHLDTLMGCAALHVYRQLNPMIIAAYTCDREGAHDHDASSDGDASCDGIAPTENCDALLDRVLARNIPEESAWAHNLRGQMLYIRSRYADASAEYRKAYLFNPRAGPRAQVAGVNRARADAYCNYGGLLVDCGKYPEAIAMFARALALDPQHAKAYINWGIALADQAEDEPEYYTEAMKKYARATEIDPRNALAFFHWGAALQSIPGHAPGDGTWREQAAAKFERAIELRPNYARAYVSWGDLLVDAGSYDDAAARYLRGLALDAELDREAVFGKLACPASAATECFDRSGWCDLRAVAPDLAVSDAASTASRAPS